MSKNKNTANLAVFLFAPFAPVYLFSAIFGNGAVLLLVFIF